MIELPIKDRTFRNLLGRLASEQGEQTFLSFEERTFTYAETDAISNRVANGLAALGIGHGDHVATLMNNCPEILWQYFGLTKLGAVTVPVNTAAKGELLAYYIRQSDARTVIVEAPLYERLVEVADDIEGLDRVIVFDEFGELAPDFATRLDVPVTDYADLEKASDAPPQSETTTVRFCDLAFLLYTSGTTGPSKGNMWTQANIITSGLDIVPAYGYTRDDVLFVCLPLLHGNALLTSLMPALVAGAGIALSRRFSVSTFWDEVRKHGATQFNSLGAMTNFIWSQPPSPDDADNPVRQCMVVPTPTEFYDDFQKRFGLEFTSLFAMTDTCMVTLRGPADPPEKWASAGRVRPEVEVRIVDDDDLELAPGEIGEIVLRGRDPWHVALGYYNKPEATAEAFRNLWFHTGDRGRIDADGYLYFVDRKKDAIRRRGENISSYEVEQIILKNQAVEDVAAFAVAAETSEDEVMVSLVLRPGSNLTPAALIDFCQQNMAYYMVPRYVEFVPDLPRTMSEKVQKYKLRDAAEARLADIWDREKEGIVVKR
ncbi:MAG: ATP-dependent acyl-CoA ligase [Alphaproteobacteria bacterium]|nr:ATP-dependent acyl-CoA ligase [Alphaproteobacteria bacterium]